MPYRSPRPWLPRGSSETGALNRRSDDGGLTLLEVMVAAAIMATVMLTLMAGFAGGARARHSARLYTRAMSRTDSFLEEKLAGGELKEGSEQGVWDGEPPINWSLNIAPRQEPPKEGLIVDKPTVFEVTLTSSWPDGAAVKSLRLATVVPIPPEKP